MQYLLYPSIFLFVVVCLFLILLVLIQKGRGGGLSSAFGGAGGNTAFGSKTGDVLTWATSIVFGIFLLLAVILNLAANKVNRQIVAPVIQTPVATTPETPAAAATPVEATPAVKTPTTGPTTQPQ